MKNPDSSGQHDRVKDLGIPDLVEIAIFIKFGVLSVHVFSRDSDLVEGQIAVVLDGPFHFGPNVAYVDPWDRFVVFVSNSHQKCLDSVVFSFGNQSGKNTSVGRVDAQFPGPELIGGNTRSVQDKLVRSIVKGSRGLEPCDI